MDLPKSLPDNSIMKNLILYEYKNNQLNLYP